MFSSWSRTVRSVAVERNASSGEGDRKDKGEVETEETWMGFKDGKREHDWVRKVKRDAMEKERNGKETRNRDKEETAADDGERDGKVQEKLLGM